MRRCLITALVFFTSARARAELSVLAIGPEQAISFTSEAVLAQGSRPDFLPVAHDYTQRRLWLHARIGATFGRSSTTALGTQVGMEMGARLGFTEEESDPLRDRWPVGFAAHSFAAFRAFTFNVPMDGMLVFLAGGEVGAGGAGWWSNSLTLSPMLGARLATRWVDELRVEADYLLVPRVITGSPRHLDVDRLEHRAALRVAYGRLALGATVVVSREQVRSRDRTHTDTTGERSLGALVEWRP